MTVYVDDMSLRANVPNGSRTLRGTWSHLMADSTEELTQFASRLGLRAAWIQQAGTPMEHFDVTAGKRALAVRLGAVPIRYGREGAALTMAKRRGETFDLDAFRQQDGRPWRARPAHS